MENNVTKNVSGSNVFSNITKNRGGEVNLKIFSKILRGNHAIKIENCERDGDVVFSIPQKDFIGEKDLKNNPIVRTKFFSNFVGELLIRQNINQFINLLIGIDIDNYNKTVCGFNHKNFGMFACEQTKTIKFQFHISLIQDILTEDINNLIKFKVV